MEKKSMKEIQKLLTGYCIKNDIEVNVDEIVNTAEALFHDTFGYFGVVGSAVFFRNKKVFAVKVDKDGQPKIGYDDESFDDIDDYNDGKIHAVKALLTKADIIEHYLTKRELAELAVQFYDAEEGSDDYCVFSKIMDGICIKSNILEEVKKGKVEAFELNGEMIYCYDFSKKATEKEVE